MGYNPRASSGRKEEFLSSASWIEVPKKRFGSLKPDLLNTENNKEKAMSVVSAQPFEPSPYLVKLLLKDINDYILMENNMIALLTIPKPDENSEETYPHLLILTIPDFFTKDISGEKLGANKGFYLYEIPSSLHLIDLSKAQFISNGNTLICLYGRDIIYWEVNQVYESSQEEPNLLVNYGHLKWTHKVQNLCPDEIQNIINVVFPIAEDFSNVSMNNSSESWNLEEGPENPYLVEKLFRRYLVTHYSPIFDLYLYEEPETKDDWNSEVEVVIEEDDNKYEVLPTVLDRIYTKRAREAFEALEFYSESVQKATVTFNSLENILSFQKGLLKDKDNKLTNIGKSILKECLRKIHYFSKRISKLSSGLKILKRINRYQNKQQILKFWYKWKINHSKMMKLETFDEASEVSTVIGETKRQIIKSIHCSNPSKNLENSSYQDYLSTNRRASKGK